MNRLIEKIDMYMDLQEKKDDISASLCNESSLDDAIKAVKKSKNKEKTIASFSKEIQKQIHFLIQGGII